MMTRKHYNAIAAALRSGKASEETCYKIGWALCEYNPTFNMGKFIVKAKTGPTMEQRAAKYRAQLLYIERWRGDH